MAETIACVLWGTDNIKTYGESLAQVMWMVVFVRYPMLGSVNKLELILPELGRPQLMLSSTALVSSATYS